METIDGAEGRRCGMERSIRELSVKPSKRFASLCLGLALVLMGATGGQAPAVIPSDTVSLENENLRITFDTTRGARLISIFSKRQNRDLAVVDGDVPLYEIQATKGSQAGSCTSLEASETSHSFPDPSTLRIVSAHPQAQMDVVCTITLPAKARTAAFGIEVSRRAADVRVVGIQYPTYTLPLEVGKVEAKVLLPVWDGQLLTAPSRALARGEIRQYPYPGPASAQVMASYDDVGGVVTYAADGEGNYKRLVVQRYRDGLALSFAYLGYQDAGPRVRVPYPVEVGAFEGGWERAADVYKEWASQQKWARTLLEDRDLPAWLKRPSFFYVADARKNSANQISESVRTWSEGLGLPVTTMLMSWEKNGPWVAPDYFPPFGGESPFRGLVQDLHRHGGFSMLYLSGLNYTLEKSKRAGVGQFTADPALRREAEASAIADFGGTIRREGTADGDIGMHLVICPATPYAKEMLSSAAGCALDLGIDVVQVDQIGGGGVAPCFSTAHGHPPGGGPTNYVSLSRLLDALRSQARGRNPAAAISLEEPGELFIPHVDLFHTREYMQRLWPRNEKGSYGVPLFSYLYHEYALGYGGDSAPLLTADDPSVPGFSPDNVRVAVYDQAMNLITGRMPAAARWAGAVPFEKADPTLRTFMKDAAALLRSDAGRYVLLGRIIDLEKQDPMQQAMSFQTSGGTLEFQAEKVLARGFELKDGTVGLLYINVTETNLTARLNFTSAKLQGSALSSWPSAGKVLRSGDEYTFPPYGMLFLRVRPRDPSAPGQS
jgi:hypothetical protein